MIKVFISHASEDASIAEGIVDLLRSALNLRSDAIRCTSVEGYRLPVGADSDEQLRNEILEARVFVGIMSPMSLASAYVLFELGARWGMKKHLAPVLAPGMTAHALRGPVASLNALSCEVAAQLHQLVQDLGRELEIQPEAPQTYQARIDALIYRSSDIPATSAPRGTSDTGSTAEQPVSPHSDGGTREPEAGQEYEDADAVIRHHCENEWPDDFSMRVYCIEQQRQAVELLRRGRPRDIPENVFRGIRRRCAAEWSDDYAMRMYCEEQQIEGYRKINEDKG